MNNITQSNLSAFGYSQYYIAPDGNLYKISAEPKAIKKDNCNRFYIVDDCGKGKRITQKKLYRKVYNKEFSIDRTAALNNEEWRIIKNTNGKYLISNYGRVKSLCGYNAKILKPDIKKNGYLVVKINKKNIMVHRLVAFNFCENKYKEQNLQVHHKDFNIKNNYYKNLVILTAAEHIEIHKKEKAANEKLLSAL